MDTSLKSRVKSHPAFPRVPTDVMATYDECAFEDNNCVFLPYPLPVGDHMKFTLETPDVGSDVLHVTGAGIPFTKDEVEKWLELDSKHWRYGKYTDLK